MQEINKTQPVPLWSYPQLLPLQSWYKAAQLQTWAAIASISLVTSLVLVSKSARAFLTLSRSALVRSSSAFSFYRREGGGGGGTRDSKGENWWESHLRSGSRCDYDLFGLLQLVLQLGLSWGQLTVLLEGKPSVSVKTGLLSVSDMLGTTQLLFDLCEVSSELSSLLGSRLRLLQSTFLVLTNIVDLQCKQATSNKHHRSKLQKVLYTDLDLLAEWFEDAILDVVKTCEVRLWKERDSNWPSTYFFHVR